MGSDTSSCKGTDAPEVIFNAQRQRMQPRTRQYPNRRASVPTGQRNYSMSSSSSSATVSQRPNAVDRHSTAISPDTFADRMARISNTWFEGTDPEYFSLTRERESNRTTPKKPIIFSPNYDIQLAGVQQGVGLDTTKWSKIYTYLVEAGVISRNSVTAPEEASEEELLMVHTREYLNKLKVKNNLARITENPLIMEFSMTVLNMCILKPLLFQTKGSILAGELALKNGWAINLGGGFHHASSEEGGGFCIYADISLCVQYVFKNCGISRVFIIDLDSHQGNGIGKDFIGDDRVYIMDIYNASVYPQDEYAEGAIRRKVKLDSKVTDAEYLRLVWDNLQESLKEFQPELILYIAGTGILVGDSMGGLSISPEAAISRDEIVYRTAWTRSIPIAIFIGGGFQRRSSRIAADSIINLYKNNLLT